ncbi:MAG: FAD-binding domain-containing protein [Verrucomicrobiota bacterium]
MTTKKTSFYSDRAASLQALADFTRTVPKYADGRNRVEEGHPHVAHLSEAIRARLVSEYEVVAAVLDEHPFAQVEKFVQEVYWRLYWKGWLEWHPEVWSVYQAELGQCDETLTGAQRQCRAKVERGESGVKIMDRFAQELVETGYLHNHSRMWFAAYWIHVCGLPWQLGADYFYRHLLDADPASNTLSWRWVAGLQTQGKTYLPRADNIRKYCDYPEAMDSMLDQQLLPVESGEPAYLQPQLRESWESTNIPHIDEPYLLWIHGEDLSFWQQQTNLPENEPAAAVMVLDLALAADYGISAMRGQFTEHAMRDTKHRWDALKSAPMQQIDGSLTESILTRAKSCKVAVVAGILPAVGPLRSLIPELEYQLQIYGIRLELWRRPQDEKVLPLAQKGFFPFWKAVRSQLV